MNEPDGQQQEKINVPLNNLKRDLPKLEERQLRQLVKQANQWADYSKYTNLMNSIAQQMRVIPVLESERVTPEKSNALQKVEFPEEGGIHTWMDKQDFPFRGYPHHEFVEKIDLIKKLSRGMMSGLYHRYKGRRFKFLTIIPALFIIKDLIRVWIYTFHRHIDRFLIKPERYSIPVRALHDAFKQNNEEERMMRDLTCMILEFDNAYRFRFQDIISVLNKNDLSLNPDKEIIRLLDILMSRERTREVKDTWRLIKFAVRFYLKFDRRLVRMIQGVLERVDVRKAGLSVEDKSYCIPRVDYTFGFQVNPTVEDASLIEVARLNKEFEEKADQVRHESTKEHERAKGKDLDVRTLDDQFTRKLKELEGHYVEQKRKILSFITP